MKYLGIICLVLILTSCHYQEPLSSIQDSELSYTELGPSFIRGCMAGIAKVYTLHKTAMPMTIRQAYGYCEEMRRTILCKERGVCSNLNTDLDLWMPL